IEAQGETRNKRLGMTFTATSYTLAGPIGGFPYFNYNSSQWALGLINGTELICPNYNLSTAGGNSHLPPYIKGSIGSGGYAATALIGCCLTKFTRDTTLVQQRTVSLLYNIAPTIQVILRYGLNSTLNNFSGTPGRLAFNAPPGYT